MRTIQEIKSDENFLCGLEIPEHNVNVYLTYIGSDKVHYDMFWKNELIFTGDDYRPSPLYPSQDSVEAVAGSLDFFVLQIGDVDCMYFDKYTPQQREWRDSEDCDELKCILNDFNNDNDEENETDSHHDARRFMQDKFVIN